MSRNLVGFTVSPSGDDYVIALEDDTGETIEFVATYDQLDLIAEAVEQQLDGDEEDALGVDGDDEPA